jgi:phosphoenolpyruvate carboxykinase (GTP)
MGDHWADWLAAGSAVADPPAVFQVNWFRKGRNGKFLWPGFGENIRVLAWMLGRLDGTAVGVDSPLGILPAEGEIDYLAAGVTTEEWEELMDVDPRAHFAESDDTERYLAGFAPRVPAAISSQLRQLRVRLAT